MPNKSQVEPLREFMASEDAMLALAEQTGIISQTVLPRTRIGYLDYPMHINVGDLLIFLGAMEFFACNRNDIMVSFCLYDECSAALNSLNDVDRIVFHGGGNFGDIYPRHQHLREKIVRLFPRKPIVIMPQSFHFGSEAALKESGKIFRRHSDVTIYVRDEPSYQIARRYFSDKVELSSDLAHRLYHWLSPIRENGSATSQEPFCLMRRDVEASAVPYNRVIGQDWSDIMRFREKVRMERHRLGAKVRGRLSISSPEALFSYHRTVQQIVVAIAKRMICYNPWITSRLHGAIFGLLLGRTIELHDNSYGKNGRYFDQWGDRGIAEGKSLTA